MATSVPGARRFTTRSSGSRRSRSAFYPAGLGPHTAGRPPAVEASVDRHRYGPRSGYEVWTSRWIALVGSSLILRRVRLARRACRLWAPARHTVCAS